MLKIPVQKCDSLIGKGRNLWGVEDGGGQCRDIVPRKSPNREQSVIDTHQLRGLPKAGGIISLHGMHQCTWKVASEQAEDSSRSRSAAAMGAYDEQGTGRGDVGH